MNEDVRNKKTLPQKENLPGKPVDKVLLGGMRRGIYDTYMDSSEVDGTNLQICCEVDTLAASVMKV
jgi:hypothetical protein